jgi:hypothetical protein
MKVTLDAAPLTDTFDTSDTLQALIDEVRDSQLGDRIVVGVTIDNQNLVDNELNRRLAEPLGDAESVELISADRQELARDALYEAAEQLAAAGEEHLTIADHLQAGRHTEAVNGFAQFLTAWQVCQRVLLECSNLLSMNLTQVQCAGAPMNQHLDELAGKLREMRDAFEARDSVLLADMVQYEMPEICQHWREILRKLGDTLIHQVPNSTS